MPDFPIIDAHIHIYDPAGLPYSWISRLPPALRRPFTLSDYRAATGALVIERAIFVEFLVDPGNHLREAEHIAGVMHRDALLGGQVAHAPVEKGAAVADDLDRLATIPSVRGIRRILDEGKLELALEPDFIEGVKTVGRYGLPFEIGVNHWGLTFGLELARRCPEVRFILNHLAKPGIRQGLWEPWRTQIREFAGLPNTVAKLSGVMAGFAGRAWREADILPYLSHAIEYFGFDRLMYGSDWPMFAPFLAYGDWAGIVDAAISGASADEKRHIYLTTATREYRLAAA